MEYQITRQTVAELRSILDYDFSTQINTMIAFWNSYDQGSILFVCKCQEDREAMCQYITQTYRTLLYK